MDSQKVNILMVDDRDENLLALEAVLTSPQYRLIKAHSGVEALKWVLREEFAVILMDVQMPTLNGFDTVKMIREREKTQDVPIIFITALSQTIENVLFGYSVGAIDYILKPFDPIILKCKVEAFVSLYLSKKKIIEQKEVISSRTIELETIYTELKKKEAMNRAIGETSMDTIVSFDEAGRILSVNPAVKAMFGYTSSEIVGRNVDILLSLVLSDIPRQAIGESVGIRKNKTSFPVEIHLADAEIETEKIYIATIRDITERKNHYEMLEGLVKQRTMELSKSNLKLHTEVEEKKAAIQKLFESEEKYRQLVENSPEAIVVRNVTSEKLSFVNETAVKLFKAESKSVMIGKSIYELIHPDEYERTKIHMETLGRSHSLPPFEKRLISLNGEVIQAQIKIIPFVYGGEESLHIVIRDMTEFKRNQEYILQTEKLSVAGELAAGIAHEIRNPLTSLKGFTQLLENKYTTESDYVGIMISEIERINTIVGELLLLAKPSSDDFKVVHIDHLLQDVSTLMSAQANLHGVAIKQDNIHTLTNVHIYGDENKLKQVFVNIIKNAIEAMENGGNITIEVNCIGKNVSISFRDSGFGIPAHVLKNIGKPFYTTKDKGTGLGLMVSKSIVESHNGEVKIMSEEGKGTTVEVIFPLMLKNI